MHRVRVFCSAGNIVIRVVFGLWLFDLAKASVVVFTEKSRSALIFEQLQRNRWPFEGKVILQNSSTIVASTLEIVHQKIELLNEKGA